MKYFISAILIIFAISIFGYRVYKNIVFKQNVTGYLKRAADANTIGLAKEELSRAITYLEKNQLTKGYTSVIYITPDEDIDFWYRNLKTSQSELQNLNSDSPLEKTNVLIKLRETLLDTSSKGTKVTVPKGISVFPNNTLWLILGWIALFSLITAFILLGIKLHELEKQKKLKTPNTDT